MRIGFISGEGVRGFAERKSGERADLLFFGFGGLGEVDYERELKGESDDCERVARLSKREENLVVCGCVTNTRGLKRRSAIVAEGGKLIGISDKLYGVDDDYSPGDSLRVYQTAVGKMGVLVGEDLYFPDAAKALVACGSDFLVCPFGRNSGSLPTLLLRATAFWQGVPILLCGRGYCAIATPEGELAFSSPSSPVFVDYEPKTERHLVRYRKKGYLPRG